MRIVSGKILSNSKLKKVKLSNFEASLMAGFSCYCCFLVPLVTVRVCIKSKFRTLLQHWDRIWQTAPENLGNLNMNAWTTLIWVMCFSSLEFSNANLLFPKCSSYVQLPLMIYFVLLTVSCHVLLNANYLFFLTYKGAHFCMIYFSTSFWATFLVFLFFID